MLKDVQFMSLARAFEARASGKTVVISILDNSKLTARPGFEGFRDVLRLTFLDICEELVRAHPGSWPAEPDTRQHALLTELPGERVFALSDARRIVEFARRHHSSTASVRVLVHCFAGSSRSAAVASWIASHFGIALRDVGRQGLANANPRVLRLLEQAAATVPD